MDPEDLMHRENQIVCGFGNEVKHMGSHDRSLEPEECHFVGYVVGAFMLLLTLYFAAEYIWSRFFAQGSIQLEGDEKALMAEHNTMAQDEYAEEALPTDLS